MQMILFLQVFEIIVFTKGNFNKLNYKKYD